MIIGVMMDIQSATQVTPASSEWKQSDVSESYAHEVRVSSSPVQATLSRWIGPVP